MMRLGKTTPFRTPYGEALPGSIAEIHALPLGGVEQWVMLRGENLANPPLLILHGGPGFSDTGFFRAFNAALERSFTVVYWDQRGAGKSYDPKLPRSSMTVEQFVVDLDELVDWVRRRVGAERVILLGHSWGSALGVLYAASFAEKVSAYVGVAQVGDWAAAERASYALALAEAKRRGDRSATRKLVEIGPPPHDAQTLFVERTLALRMANQMGPRAMWNAARAVLGVRESSVLDLPTTFRAFRFSLDAMWSEVSRLNLVEAVPALTMPVHFFLGRRDPWIPPDVSVAYFDALSAPSKRLVWFEESGHEPFVDEAEKFNISMLELVRPVIQRAQIASAKPGRTMTFA